MIGLDFETYGSRDLRKVGLHNYVSDPHFQPLIAVVRYPNSGWLEFDFVKNDFHAEAKRLKEVICSEDHTIAAHNANFERVVLHDMEIDIPPEKFIDTAVIAAYYGAGRSLEAAASQLLNSPKYEGGLRLIKKFSIPGEYQNLNGHKGFDPQIVEDNPDDWKEFMHYCHIDSMLSLEMASKWIPAPEKSYAGLTMRMNDIGWPVDIKLVEEMQARYEENLVQVTADFAATIDGPVPNLSSTTQLKKWCAERGVRSSSFDEERVETMLDQMDKRLARPNLTDAQRAGYLEVKSMLLAKRDLGGSSLKKLKVLLQQTGEDGRLHDSYLHFGAQATGRTTGRGVQMQNLPRLHGEGDDMDELHHRDIEWSNRKLASNLRQVFCASDPSGQLVVGDFSSVESRGLAWQAGEQWKLDAYAQGQDLYKVLATRIYSTSYDTVTKDQRQVGKTGELSCGYGAGAGAVQAFAKKMGVSMTEAEAATLVRDWRWANPAIVKWWELLQECLLQALTSGSAVIKMPWGTVEIDRIKAPASLQDLGPKHSLIVSFVSQGMAFQRYIHGVQLVGRNMTYWKPSERKTGGLWSPTFTDPKTKKQREYTVYGGKLAGLLTQSLCREMFFQSLEALYFELMTVSNAQIIGQFHDEIVVDWTPTVGSSISLAHLIRVMEQAMTFTPLHGFPLGADIKCAYRYIK